MAEDRKESIREPEVRPGYLGRGPPDFAGVGVLARI